MTMPWFRLYSEVLDDPKLHRAGKMAGQPYAIILGVWTVLLALANHSPKRGELRFSDELWWHYDEIREKTGLEQEIFDSIMGAFADLKLISTATGDDWLICNWDKRQFKSDSSTERVQRFRKRQTEMQEELQEQSVPVVETLQEQSCNVLDPDPEADPESDPDPEDSAATASPPTPPPKPKTRAKKPKTPPPKAVQAFRECAHRFPAKAWFDKVATAVGEAETDLAFWREVVTAWVGLGWNPTNVKGMLECYRQRRVPGGGRATSRASPEPVGLDAMREIAIEEGWMNDDT